MSGLGFKTWTAGDVLTAADVNGYLMSQAVMVFADAAARTTALTSPSEGMVTYLEDTNTLWFYNGSAWENALTLGQWISFTPTFTSIGAGTDWVIGNATTDCAYSRVGRSLFFRVQVTWGNTTTFGTKALGMSLPLASTAYAGTNHVLGQANYFDADTADNYVGNVAYRGQTEVQFTHAAVSTTLLKNGLVTSTLPFTWASTDQLAAQFYLEGNDGL